MSLGVVIKGPEGVVLAADSRITLEAHKEGEIPLLVNFDNATKLLAFSGKHTYVGVVTYGVAVIGLRTAHSYIPEFELSLPDKRLNVEDYAQRMSAFYLKTWKEIMPGDYKGPSMTFIVGGYDDKSPYGKVFLFEIPSDPQPQPRNPGETEFGMTWGGQLNVASRLIHGFDPTLPANLSRRFNLNQQQASELNAELIKDLGFQIPYNVLPLQDCIDLAIFLVRTTIVAQGLAVAVRGVGGPIDVAVITRTKGLKFVQRKQTHGEDQNKKEVE